MTALGTLAAIAQDVRDSANPDVTCELQCAEGARTDARAQTMASSTAMAALYRDAATHYLAAVQRHNLAIGGKILDAAELLQVAAIVAR